MTTHPGGEIQAEGAEAQLTPGGLLIRPAEARDLEALARIEAQSYSNPWHPSSMRSLLDQERARLLVAEDPGRGVVGHAIFWWVLDQAELANLAVDPGVRRRGVGAALLDRVMAEAGERNVASIYLEVRWSNEAAHHLYLTRGFMQVSVRKGYYQNPKEDARVLVRFLGPAPGEAGGVGE